MTTATTTRPVTTYINDFFGRRTIYSSIDDVNEDNIISELNTALTYHIQNLIEEETLYWYRRGITPILERTKEVRPEINHKVNESGALAGYIVDFKNGYFITQPAFYVSRNEQAQNKVDILNEYLYRSGKQKVDNKLADWFHTVGKAALMIQATGNEEIPVKAYCLDPRSAFVVYSMSPGNRPIMGVNMVVSGDNLYFDVYTEKYVFRLMGTKTGKIISDTPSYTATATSIISVEKNLLTGKIPIIEYQYNSVNMGAFEGAISLLDSLAEAQSDRLDGLSQQIQNLLVLYNCNLEDGTTANTIRQAGMIQLKSVGENKADVKDITTVLDQSQTQVLIDDIFEKILTICALPTTSKGGSSTSDTGAAVLARDGWYQADAAARNTEDLFKESNARFDEIFVEILRRANLLDIKMTDFELSFVRNETANIQSKAQSFQTLMSAGLEPTLALGKSGVSNDPVADYKMSEAWMKLRWGDPSETQAITKESDIGSSL